MSEIKNVVITGRSILSPAGDTLEEVLSACENGESNFSKVESVLNDFGGSNYIGTCKKVDRKVLPDRKVQKAISRKDLIGLISAIKAASDAGIEKGVLDPERFGMYVGSGSTQVCDLAPYFPLIEKSTGSGEFDGKVFGRELLGSVNPMVMLQTLMNNTLCYAAVALDIRGLNANFMDFQVSGLKAVGEAYHAILDGRADVMLAGGVASQPEPLHAEQGIRFGYLARTDEEGKAPDAAIRPYDKDRAGTIISEGAAFVVLESEEHAIRRGANILGRVGAYSLGSDGDFAFMNTTPSKGLERSLRHQLQTLKRSGDHLGLLMGHGNGSVYGDSVEAQAYVNALGVSGHELPLTSNKTLLGEMCEAAAVSNLILGLEYLEKKRCPGTFNFSEGDELTKKLSVTKTPQEVRGGGALITSRSFSGLSCSLSVFQG